MTFAAAERAYLTPPDDYSCERCEDVDSIDHDECVELAEEARGDYLISQEEARREEEGSYTPNWVA